MGALARAEEADDALPDARRLAAQTARLGQGAREPGG